MMGRPNVNVIISGPSNEATSQYKTKILRTNIPFASQVVSPDTKYVIKYDFDLNDLTVYIPENCIIEIDGGQISNGTLVGDTILINTNQVDDILKNVTKEGTWKELNEEDLKNRVSVIEETLDNVTKKVELALKNRVYLEGTTLTQDMINTANTIYVVKYNMDLDGKEIIIPENCILEFDGGSFSNGSVILNDSIYNINNGILKNVSILLNNASCKIENTNIINTTHDTIINANNTILDINCCDIYGENDIAILTNKVEDTHHNHVKINNCTIHGSFTTAALRLIGNENMSTYTCYCSIDNCIITLEKGEPYIVIGYTHAVVRGGEFSSPESTCNLYGNNTSEILGGYYHDMQRGATIGGKRGHRACVIGTINRNITNNGGISIDLAEDSSQGLYSDGIVTVSSNVVENAKYGMFIQGKRIVITSNYIKGGENSSTYGIRINNRSEDTDDHILVSNNIIDYEGQNTYCIFAGNNTSIKAFNNICYSNYQYIAGGDNSNVKDEKNIVNINEIESSTTEFIIPFTTDIINISSKTEYSARLRFNNNNAALQNIFPKTIKVVNNSNNNSIILFRTSTNVNGVPYNAGNCVIFPHSTTLVTFNALTEVTTSVFNSYNIGITDGRPVGINVGYNWYDTTLNKPIWWNGSAWIDANGNSVDSE